MEHLLINELGGFGNVLCNIAIVLLVAVDQATGLEVKDVLKLGIDRLEHLW